MAILGNEEIKGRHGIMNGVIVEVKDRALRWYGMRTSSENALERPTIRVYLSKVSEIGYKCTKVKWKVGKYF